MDFVVCREGTKLGFDKEIRMVENGGEIVCYIK